MRAAGGAGRRRPEQRFHHEHHRRRRHVAEAAQHVARGVERGRAEIERAFDRVEDRATARMHAPEVDRRRRRAVENVFRMAAHRVVHGGRHLAGQDHVEAGIANIPGHQLARIGGEHGLEAVELDALRLGRHEARGAAVAPEQEREDLLEVGRLLEMHRAKLEVDDEDARRRRRSGRCGARASAR